MAWGNKGTEGAAPVRGASGMSFLGREVTINGNIAGGGDLHIDGEINGDVACATLVLGGEGRVNGNIHAQKATIAGAVEGTVNADTVIVERSGRVKGDLAYTSVSIETGAQVEGRLTQKGGGGELKLVSSAGE
jgi:cytoskeletal protein CcmA (bactofilin family)